MITASNPWRRWSRRAAATANGSHESSCTSGTTIAPQKFAPGDHVASLVPVTTFRLSPRQFSRVARRSRVRVIRAPAGSGPEPACFEVMTVVSWPRRPSHFASAAGRRAPVMFCGG